MHFTKIPFTNLALQHANIKNELLNAVEEVITHGRFILGSEVSEFEELFALLVGTKYAVGVNSGTDALLLSLKALNVGSGDEVITVPNSFVASTSCIALAGAKPVFVDVGHDFNMNVDLIESAITNKTKAILPVHLTGRPCDMDNISAIAQKYGLFVIEDSAQSVCAEYKSRKTGGLGTVGCFSFHPLKTLNACGDGGIITTNDANLYQDLKLLRNHGLLNRDECQVWGYNSRLDTIQATMLKVGLRYIEEWTDKRRHWAHMYQDLLRQVPQVTTPIDKSYEKAVYHTFVIQADRRDDLKSYLQDNGIGTNIHYPIPIHLQKVSRDLGYSYGSFPISEKQSESILSLPVYPELDSSQVQYIVETISHFYDKG